MTRPENTPESPVSRKPLVRRDDPDDSQRLRLGFQLAFIALNCAIGVRFYQWARQFETGSAISITRPAGVEGWLPIASLMNLKAWISTGVVPAIHPAGMFLLIAFIAMSLLFRKTFCSWLCPIGTISEYLWKAGRRIFGRNLVLPDWLDLPLRSVKYLLFAFFGWAVLNMPAEEVASFMSSPYGIVADVKLMNFFRSMGVTALIVIAVLTMLSILVRNFWCRYLCPYGALLGVVALLSPAGIRRDESACIDCAKCAKACPARLPVDVKPAIRSAECTLCMECVAVCPARGALQVSVRQTRIGPRAIAATVAFIFLGVVAAARMSGHWQTVLPDAVYQYLIPRIESVDH